MTKKNVFLGLAPGNGCLCGRLENLKNKVGLRKDVANKIRLLPIDEKGQIDLVLVEYLCHQPPLTSGA